MGSVLHYITFHLRLIYLGVGAGVGGSMEIAVSIPLGMAMKRNDFCAPNMESFHGGDAQLQQL